jgi:enoyl-CoA hydratase/carnithine racemase
VLRRNALDNRALMAEIVETADGLATDPQLRFEVPTGAGGRAFIGGADIGEIAALDEAVEGLVRPILAAAAKAIRLQKSLILDREELPMAAAVQRGIDCFVTAYDTDEPARMAGAMLAELRARRRPPP